MIGSVLFSKSVSLTDVQNILFDVWGEMEQFDSIPPKKSKNRPYLGIQHSLPSVKV